MRHQSYLIFSFLCLFIFQKVQSQTAMINIDSRNLISLNGKWQTISDPTDIGDWRQIWLEKKPEKKTDFVEYAFDGVLDLMYLVILIPNYRN